ncbi:UPF0158 family protein [Formosa undariae]|uniref:UPF0158 family protein n=1 Tax=Formosa undariae TaxID=1325436 RepID=A0ABV5EY86_9FLAO
MNHSKLQSIKEMAQELDCGSDCYYNTKTDKVIAIPNFSELIDEDQYLECFGEALEEIEKNKADIIKIDVLNATESFQIMERFANQLSDPTFRIELETILKHKKPFQNFKYAIDQSEFRQAWFDFKIIELEKIVALKLN